MMSCQRLTHPLKETLASLVPGEGQLHFKKNNIDSFDSFEVNSNEIFAAIEQAYNRKA